MTYYATLTAMGVDLFPSKDLEVFIFMLANFIGVLAYGIIVGNFADMLERIT